MHGCIFERIKGGKLSVKLAWCEFTRWSGQENKTSPAKAGRGHLGNVKRVGSAEPLTVGEAGDNPGRPTSHVAFFFEPDANASGFIFFLSGAEISNTKARPGLCLPSLLPQSFAIGLKV